MKKLLHAVAGWLEDRRQWRRATLDEFLAAHVRAVTAIEERPPLTAAEQEAGWREDPGGSGLRVNEQTGELDDSCFVSHPPWYQEYRANLIRASGERQLRTTPSGGSDASGSWSDYVRTLFTQMQPLDDEAAVMFRAWREDEALQAAHARDVASVREGGYSPVCPACGAEGDALSWFWFRTPDSTWKALAGRAGVAAVCERDGFAATIVLVQN